MGVQQFLPPPPIITTDKNRIRFLLTKLWHYNVTLKLGSLQWRERDRKIWVIRVHNCLEVVKSRMIDRERKRQKEKAKQLTKKRSSKNINGLQGSQCPLLSARDSLKIYYKASSMFFLTSSSKSFNLHFYFCFCYEPSRRKGIGDKGVLVHIAQPIQFVTMDTYNET